MFPLNPQEGHLSREYRYCLIQQYLPVKIHPKVGINNTTQGIHVESTFKKATGK